MKQTNNLIPDSSISHNKISAIDQVSGMSEPNGRKPVQQQSSESLFEASSDLSLQAEMDKESRLTLDEAESSESLLKQRPSQKRRVNSDEKQVATQGSLLMDVVKQEVHTTRLQVKRVPAHPSKLCFLTEHTTEKRTKMVVSPRTGRNLQRDSLAKSFIPSEVCDALAQQREESSPQSDSKLDNNKHKETKKKRKNRKRKKKAPEKMENLVADYRTEVEQRPNCLNDSSTSLLNQHAESGGKPVRVSATRLELPQPSRSELRFKAHKVDFQMATVAELAVKLSPRGHSTKSYKIEPSLSKSPSKSLFGKNVSSDQRVSIKTTLVKRKEHKDRQKLEDGRDESSILFSLPNELLDDMKEYLQEKEKAKKRDIKSSQPNTQDSSSNFVSALSVSSSKTEVSPQAVMEPQESSVLFINPLLVQPNESDASSEVTNKSSGIIYTIPRDDSSIKFSNPKLMISPRAKLQKKDVSPDETKVFEKIDKLQNIDRIPDSIKLIKSSPKTKSRDDYSEVISNPHLMKSPKLVVNLSEPRLPTPRSHPMASESSETSIQSQIMLESREEIESKVTIGKPSQYSLAVDLLNDDSSFKLSNPNLKETPKKSSNSVSKKSSELCKYPTSVNIPPIRSGNRSLTSQKSNHKFGSKKQAIKTASATLFKTPTQQVATNPGLENSGTSSIKSDLDGLNKLTTSLSRSKDESLLSIRSEEDSSFSLGGSVKTEDSRVLAVSKSASKLILDSIDSSPSKVLAVAGGKPQEHQVCVQSSIPRQVSAEPVVQPFETEVPSQEFIMGKRSSVDLRRASGQVEHLTPEEIALINKALREVDNSAPEVEDKDWHSARSTHDKPPSERKDLKKQVISPVGPSGKSAELEASGGPVHAVIADAAASSALHSHSVPPTTQLDKSSFTSPIQLKTTSPKSTVLATNANPEANIATIASDKPMSGTNKSLSSVQQVHSQSPTLVTSEMGTRRKPSTKVLVQSSDVKLPPETQTIGEPFEPVASKQDPQTLPIFKSEANLQSGLSTVRSTSESTLPSEESQPILAAATSSQLISDSFIRDESSLIISNPTLMASPKALSSSLINEKSPGSNLDSKPDLIVTSSQVVSGERVASNQSTSPTGFHPRVAESDSTSNASLQTGTSTSSQKISDTSFIQDDSSELISNPKLKRSPNASSSGNILLLESRSPIAQETKNPISKDKSTDQKVKVHSPTHTTKSPIVSPSKTHSLQTNLIEEKIVSGDKNLLLEGDKEPKSSPKPSQSINNDLTKELISNNPLNTRNDSPEVPTTINQSSLNQEMWRFGLFQANVVKTLDKIEQNHAPRAADIDKLLEPTEEEVKACTANLTPDELVKQNQLLMDHEKDLLAKMCEKEGKGQQESSPTPPSAPVPPARRGWITPQVALTLGGIASAVAAMRLIGSGNNNTR